MASAATNVMALSLFNQGRKNLEALCKKVEDLSSGQAINRGADDPSGLTISTSLSSQIRGAMSATQNAQDGINLLNLADSALGEAQDILMRMKDVSLKMSNEATTTETTSNNPDTIVPSDERTLFKEMATLAVELKRSMAGIEKAPPDEPVKPSVNYNGKVLFDGSYEPEYNQVLQVGPDNGKSFQSLVTIPSMVTLVDTIDTGQFPGNYTMQDFVNYATSHIDEITKDIGTVSDVRTKIGTQVDNLEKTINDLSAQTTYNSAYKSNISDADMAQVVTQMTKLQIISQAANMVASQVNADALLILPLMNAVLPVETPGNPAAPPSQFNVKTDFTSSQLTAKAA